MATSFKAAVDNLKANHPECLKHTTARVLTDTYVNDNDNDASDALARGVCVEHWDLVTRMRSLYEGVFGTKLLDYEPRTEKGKKFLDSAVRLLHPDGLLVMEQYEASINSAHTKRLEIVKYLVYMFLIEAAGRQNRRLKSTPIDLEKLATKLKGFLHVGGQRPLRDATYTVKPDHTFFWGTVNDFVDFCPIEDKTSPGMGPDGVIDFDEPSENETTKQAVCQVYTQVYLAKGSIGLLTSLKNGTWVYGHRGGKTLLMSKNLTPPSMDNDFQRLEIITEAEVLCTMFALHECAFKELKDVFAGFPGTNTILPRLKSPFWWVLWKSIIWNAWLSLSVLLLRLMGPSLLRTSWIGLYLWTSRDSIFQMHAWPKSAHRLQFPLLLKADHRLGQGAHGTVTKVHGMNLVVKIGNCDIIRQEASFYMRARMHRGLPMLKDFGAFDFEGLSSTALLLELAQPIDDAASLENAEVRDAVTDLNVRLGVHHHDIFPQNIVRGLMDGKLKIIDYAKAVDAQDCVEDCEG
ncbi:hypothetical protein Hypma_010442 [Hypsizygus marmoreus]|uniref:Protein kinase domain-containing protein n=1 Tax=Hypsizygus marmoreus TaxID=39966 RepID=A0A369K6F8_HYPMA|nr:hypothetical protein Hypma_010442 [Hypsizygus marmoreus]